DPFPFSPKDINAVVLTHAHLDHCGRLPLLCKQGFDGPIYCTEATKELTKLILLDAAHIQQHDTLDENRRRAQQHLPPREPLFTEHDVHATIAALKPIHFHQPHQITHDIEAVWFGSGHILGAGSVRIKNG